MEEPIHLQDVKNFQPHFWVSCILATIFYSVIFPFQSTAVKLFMTRYDYSELQSGRMVSLLPFSSIFLSPIFGALVALRPKYAYINSAAIVLFVACFGIMAYADIPPIATIMLMSVPYSLVPACIFPYLSLVIPQQYNGTGYGLFTCIMNFGMVIIYYMQGWVLDFFKNNTQYVLLFYGGLAILALVANIVWMFLEYNSPADLMAQTWAAQMKDHAQDVESDEEGPVRTISNSGDKFAVPDAEDFKKTPRISKSYGHVLDMKRADAPKEHKVTFLSTRYDKKKKQIESVYSGHQSLKYGSMAYGFKVVKKTDQKGKPEAANANPKNAKPPLPKKSDKK